MKQYHTSEDSSSNLASLKSSKVTKDSNLAQVNFKTFATDRKWNRCHLLRATRYLMEYLKKFKKK